MSKKDKLLSILSKVQELYPHLDRVMITDLDNPDSIILTSEDNLKDVAVAHDLDEDYLDQITQEVDVLVEYDDDDEDDGGIFH